MLKLYLYTGCGSAGSLDSVKVQNPNANNSPYHRLLPQDNLPVSSRKHSIARRTGWLSAALALVVGGALSAVALGVLYLVLHTETSQRLDAELTQLSTQATENQSPQTLIASPGAGIDLIALIDSTGNVTSSDNKQGLSLPEGIYQHYGATSPTIIDGVSAGDIEYHTVGQHMTIQGQTYLVLVGIEQDQARHFYLLAALVFGLLVPVLALAAGALTRQFVGRTLSPVEQIRAEVEQITDSGLDRRVAVPARENELAALARTMNGMLARLEDAQNHQIRFIADASHELRSPLTTLSGLAEIAKMTGEPIDLESVESLIAPEIERMQNLVDDLLASAGASAGVFETVDVDDIVFAEKARARVLYPHLTVSGTVTPTQIVGHRDALTRAVRNLADNSYRYAHQQVNITLETADSWIYINVENDGPPLTDDEKQLVQERFGRTDSSRHRATGGAGLGLAIVKDIALAHGGQLTLNDSPLGGLKTTLVLPSPSFPQ